MLLLIKKIVCQAVTGITLPSGSDKLYSGSEDETVRVWDCQSGQVVPICIFCLRYFTLFLFAFFKYWGQFDSITYDLKL